MTGTGTTYEVLIVDDEPGDVELVRLALAAGPFHCNATVAANGEEAMKAMRQQPPYQSKARPDLVLLDLNMPQKGGKEVLSEMKADPALAAIPVVVLTTSDVERDIVASYRLGAAGYLAKPIDTETLFKAIRGITEYWFSVVRRPE
jgi:CheY-like chemotaxis protein